MITCPKCQKENQDHYKFCLGCGAKLSAPAPRPAAPAQPAAPQPTARAPAPQADPTMGRAHAAPQPGPAAGPAPAAPGPAPQPTAPAAPRPRPQPGAPSAAPDTAACPSCGTPNPQGFNFCGRCGTPLAPAPAPAPRPAAASAAPPPGIVPPAGGAAALPSAADVGSARTIFMDASATAAAPGKKLAARLVMLGADGNPVGERLLENESLLVGRDEGPPWSDDTYLDPKHATISPAEGGVRVEDHGSLNGIFFRLVGRTEIRDQDQFRIGQELLRFEELPEPAPAADGTEKMGSPNPGYWGRLVTLVDPDVASSAWPFSEERVVLGREEGDVTFPHDGYVSGTHARIEGSDTGIFLEDLDSSNGTYVRVRSGDLVPFGTTVLIGQRLFRIEAP